jgi:type I restriction enzyme, R subunit
MNQTREAAFESYVETILLERSGWHQGERDDWHVDLALFPSEVVGFVRDTQTGSIPTLSCIFI